jgi:hypothetical protein
MDSRFDDILHTVISEKGQGIYGFFDVIFGFMYRRTDFFYEMVPGENMGFYPGQAEAIVYNFMKKYQNIHYKERVPKRNIDPKEIEEYIKNQQGKNTAKTTPEVKKDEKNNEKPNNAETKTETNKIVEEVKANEKVEEKIHINDNKINEVKSEVVQPKVISISTYNGDSCDNYNWSQGVMDVSIQIKLPEINSKKDVNI